MERETFVQKLLLHVSDASESDGDSAATYSRAQIGRRLRELARGDDAEAAETALHGRFVLGGSDSEYISTAVMPLYCSIPTTPDTVERLPLQHAPDGVSLDTRRGVTAALEEYVATLRRNGERHLADAKRMVDALLDFGPFKQYLSMWEPEVYEKVYTKQDNGPPIRNPDWELSEDLLRVAVFVSSADEEPAHYYEEAKNFLYEVIKEKVGNVSGQIEATGGGLPTSRSWLPNYQPAFESKFNSTDMWPQKWPFVLFSGVLARPGPLHPFDPDEYRSVAEHRDEGGNDYTRNPLSYETLDFKRMRTQPSTEIPDVNAVSKSKRKRAGVGPGSFTKAYFKAVSTDFCKEVWGLKDDAMAIITKPARWRVQARWDDNISNEATGAGFKAALACFLLIASKKKSENDDFTESKRLFASSVHSLLKQQKNMFKLLRANDEEQNALQPDVVGGDHRTMPLQCRVSDLFGEQKPLTGGYRVSKQSGLFYNRTELLVAESLLTASSSAASSSTSKIESKKFKVRTEGAFLSDADRFDLPRVAHALRKGLEYVCIEKSNFGLDAEGGLLPAGMPTEREKQEEMARSIRTHRERSWQEAFRETRTASDRLLRFVHCVSGFLGEPAESIVTVSDPDASELHERQERARKEAVARVGQLQAKVVQAVVEAALRQSTLGLAMQPDRPAGKGMADAMVVVDKDARKTMRDLESGASGRPFFDAAVELKNALGQGGYEQPLKMVLRNIEAVGTQYHSFLSQYNVSSFVRPSPEAIGAPHNSYMLRLKAEVVAALRKSHGLLCSEVGAHDHRMAPVSLWELMEGKDEQLSCLFAELCAKLVQHIRMTGTSLSAYVGIGQVKMNAIAVRMALGKAVNGLCRYRARQPRQPEYCKGKEGRHAYFKEGLELPGCDILGEANDFRVGKRKGMGGGGGGGGGDDGDDGINDFSAKKRMLEEKLKNKPSDANKQALRDLLGLLERAKRTLLGVDHRTEMLDKNKELKDGDAFCSDMVDEFYAILDRLDKSVFGNEERNNFFALIEFACDRAPLALLYNVLFDATKDGSLEQMKRLFEAIVRMNFERTTDYKYVSFFGIPFNALDATTSAIVKYEIGRILKAEREVTTSKSIFDFDGQMNVGTSSTELKIDARAFKYIVRLNELDRGTPKHAFPPSVLMKTLEVKGIPEEINSLSTKLDELKRYNAELRSEMSELQENINNLNASNTELRLLLDRTRINLEYSQLDNKDFEGLLANARSAYFDVRKKLQETKLNLESLSKRYNVLSSTYEEYQNEIQSHIPNMKGERDVQLLELNDAIQGATQSLETTIARLKQEEEERRVIEQRMQILQSELGDSEVALQKAEAIIEELKTTGQTPPIALNIRVAALTEHIVEAQKTTGLIDRISEIALDVLKDVRVYVYHYQKDLRLLALFLVLTQFIPSIVGNQENSFLNMVQHLFGQTGLDFLQGLFAALFGVAEVSPEQRARNLIKDTYIPTHAENATFKTIRKALRREASRCGTEWERALGVRARARAPAPERGVNEPSVFPPSAPRVRRAWNA